MSGYSTDYQRNKKCIPARWYSLQTRHCVEWFYFKHKVAAQFKIVRKRAVPYFSISNVKSCQPYLVLIFSIE